jgi:Ca2+-binding RTX toxin-like protein
MKERSREMDRMQIPTAQIEARRTPRFARLVAVVVAALAGLVFAAPSLAAPVTFAEIVNQTDWTQAGIAGVGNDASVSIALSGVSGTVKKAYLYYHGIGNPTYAPTGVTFNGVAVTPTSIGDSSTNCWGTGSSTAYRADVTAQVIAAGGNATYSVDNLANGSGLSANGASLIVFFDDGNAANNRDVALFEGNDSDFAGFPGDPEGWQATLSGINYTTGTVGASFHVGDGQDAGDGNVTFAATPNNGGTNPLTISDTPTTFDGVSLPNNGSGRNGHGLWDIHQFDITALFNNTAGTYSIDLTHPFVDDCLALIVLALDFQAGTLPQEICGNGIDDDGDGQIDEDCPIDTAPTCDGVAATIYVGADGRIVGGPDNGKLYRGKLNGTPSADVMVGTAGRDEFAARGGNDRICGGEGKDELEGGGGHDALFGEGGNDVLDAGGGNDTMTGGLGADKFRGGAGTDTATDFTPAQGDTKTGVEVF